MAFWNKKSKEEKSKNTFFIGFTLYDKDKFKVDVSWPLNADLTDFIGFLKALNDGEFVKSQIAQSVMYADSIKQPESALPLVSALMPFTKPNAKKTIVDNKPVIRPSKVLENFFKQSS